MIKVGFKKLSENAVIPKFAKPGDAGFDFHSAETVIIPAHTTVIVKTDLAVELPKNTELQVRCRSGIAAKTPLIVKNSPGTVDEGYKGNIGIILHNLSDKDFLVEKGERIAQGVVKKTYDIEIYETCDLSESERGSDGFGSTGV